MRNAIPRESFAVITLEGSAEAAAKETLAKITSEIQTERKTSEPGLNIELKQTDDVSQVMTETDQKTLFNLVYASPNGVDLSLIHI